MRIPVNCYKMEAMEKKKIRDLITGILTILLLSAAFCSHSAAGEKMHIDLEGAINLALSQNRAIEITKMKMAETRYKLAEMRSHYLPRLSAGGTYGYNTNPAEISIKKGEYTHLLPEMDPFPPEDITFTEGNDWFYKSNVTISQPLSQIFKIRSGVDIALADLDIARTKQRQIESEIRYAMEEIYYGILIASRRKREAECRVDLEKAKLYNAENAVDAGEALKLDVSGLKAELLEKEKTLLGINNRIDNLKLMLNNLMRLPLDTDIVLEERFSSQGKAGKLEGYLKAAPAGNPKLIEADQIYRKAGLGVTAAKREYIPDISLFARYNHEEGIPLTPNDYGIIGVNLDWCIFDFGQKSSVVKQRISLENQARKNSEREKNEIQAEIRKEYNRLKYAEKLLVLTSKTVEFRKDAFQLASELNEAGLRLNTKKIEARADLAKAKADLLAARLNYRLTISKLNKLSGRN